MTLNKLRYNMTQWFLVIIPVVTMIFIGMISFSVAEIVKKVDGKASRGQVDALCVTIEKKVDNATLLEMIKTLRQKDEILHEETKRLNDRVDRTEVFRVEQLKVLGEIKVQMEKMNGKMEQNAIELRRKVDLPRSN